MTSWLLTAIVALPLPLLILTYYWLRLGLRRGRLEAKIQELGLEREYLRVFHYDDFVRMENHGSKVVVTDFRRVFAKQFRGDNSLRNYWLPLLLTAATTTILGIVVWRSLGMTRSVTDYVKAEALPFAIAGALFYSIPSFISRFASLSLNPHTVLDLLAKLWLSVVIGVLLAVALPDQVQALVAFIGGLTPGPALELLQKKVFGQKSEAKATNTDELLSILGGDDTLLLQLNYIGVRSTLELAYENPLKIFVETDLNLVVCIDLVDQANLRLYVPESEIRRDLNRYGVRTAIDLMTQVYQADDPTDENSDWHFVDPEKALPPSLEKSLGQMAGAMKLDLPSFRNTVQMMVDNPQLGYVLALWNTVSEEIADREGNASTPIQTPVPISPT